MKITRIFLAVFSYVSIVYAEDGPATFPTLSTLNGKTYQTVVVTARTPAHISIRHESGLSRIRLVDLPEKLRKQYGYDPKAAKAYEEKEAADARIAEKATAAQEKALRAKEAAAAKSAQKAAAARQKAEDKKREADALAASGTEMELIIMQSVKGGFLVNNVEYDAISARNTSAGGGGNVLEVRRRGHQVFFVSAYPPKKGGRPDGESLKGSFVEDGTYSYTDTQGANRTVKKLVYVGVAKPSVPKTPTVKPSVNPLRQKPRRLGS